MFLREFIYFDKQHAGTIENNRYNPEYDQTILNSNDVRKTPRLTLKTINDIRKAGEARELELEENLGLIRKMYAAPPPEASAP